jgi:capsule polysaccharide export protein KpsE/RkpR
MKIKLPFSRSKFNCLFQECTVWFERHWIKVLAIVFCSYLAAERNLSIQLQLSTRHPSINTFDEHSPKAPKSAPVALTSFKDAKKDALTQQRKNYVQRFAKVAQVEMDKYGIRCYGIVVFWYCGVMVLWCYGIAVLWY